jgi:phosphoribosylglycinamide formyltransferase-1
MERIKSKIIIIASGRGSNFEAIAKAVQTGVLNHIEICCLISNRSDARALEIAKNFLIPFHVLESKQYRMDGSFQREAYEKDLKTLIESYNPDWICLAGYLLLLGSQIINQFSGRIINIHPSLLPQFKGLNAQKQALEAGVTETGCTVHFVTEELDAGPVILQKKLTVLASDTEESLSRRLLPLEHQAYVEALLQITSGDVPKGSR